MEETVSTFLGLLCAVAPCLLLIAAIGAGIAFFVKRSKKAVPASTVASVQPAESGLEQPNLTNLSLAPSEVVALKGDLFAPAAGALNSWQLVGSGTKVSGPPLAQKMVSVAFLALEQAGDVRLVQGKKKATLGLREVDTLIVIPAEQSSDWPTGSFEAKIITSARTRQASNRNNVKDIVYDVLEEKASLVWDWALRLAHKGMAKRGLLDAEAKKGLFSNGLVNYSLNSATSPALAQINPVAIQQLLQSSEKNRPGLFQLLGKEIKQGFDSRKEASDSGGLDMND